MKKTNRFADAFIQRTAANIRMFRAEDEMTLRELSQRLQDAGYPISVSILSRIERGVRIPDLGELWAIGTVLGRSAFMLIARQPDFKEGEDAWAAALKKGAPEPASEDLLLQPGQGIGLATPQA